MNAINAETQKNLQSPARTIAAEIDSPFCLTRIPAMEFSDERYVLRFARTTEEIEAALHLRFEVFNLELGEGFESSYINGLDEDRFDAVCHHLIVAEKTTGAIVGTYRLQTLEMARASENFYCAGEFKLDELPAGVLEKSLEIGRACVALEHRNTRVLFLLWKGLAAYATASRKRYFFGCCSLTSQDENEGWRAMWRIEKDDLLHPNFFVTPQADYVCETEYISREKTDYQLPKLFLTYLRFGAKVCSPPAIDRAFKTIDFFVMFDFETIDEKTRRMLFG